MRTIHGHGHGHGHGRVGTWLPLLLLLIACGGASAQWTNLATSSDDDGNATIALPTTRNETTTSTSTSTTQASTTSISTTQAPTTQTATTTTTTTTQTTEAATTAAATAAAAASTEAFAATLATTQRTQSVTYATKPLYTLDCPVCPRCLVYASGDTTATFGGLGTTMTTTTTTTYKRPLLLETMSSTTSSSTATRGEAVNYGERDYQAILFATHDREIGVYCSGVFVDRSTVLTAAHCLYDANGLPYEYLRVTNGNADRTTVTYLLWMRVRSNDNAFVHPDYVPRNASDPDNESDRARLALDDLAIVRLAMTTALDYVKPVDITDEADVFVRNRGSFVVTGYGRDANGFPRKYMRAYRMDPLSRDECSSVLGSAICATGRVLATRGSAHADDNLCRVESGAPLVQKRAFLRRRLVGLASFVSEQNCAYGNLNVFVNLPYYRDWINRIVPNLATTNGGGGGASTWGFVFR